MSVFSHPAFDSHEQIVFCHDKASGLRAIIALHDTRLGPALGGCRMFPYACEDDALRDVLRLSRGMTYKASLAQLPLGGGKSVIIGDPRTGKSAPLLHAMGDFVESLGGRYITAADYGTGVPEMQLISQRTRHVADAKPRAVVDDDTENGDPSPSTVRGIFAGLRAAVRYRLGTDDLTGLKVAIQGMGHVGFNLGRKLKAAGAELWVSDIHDASVQRAHEELGAHVVNPQDIYALDVDVFSPCAMSGILDADVLDVLRANVIAGAANNQLAAPEIGVELQRRGCLYAPDYAINAGGLIDVYYARTGGSTEALEAHVESIGMTLTQIFRRADEEGVATSVVADRLAMERLNSAAAAGGQNALKEEALGG
jgi:leucine dehydrogenase